ncbi:unnamed protein product [Soboliphyme baturini]|uniref:KLRAQ domain-containing protein n=1 Tax=Soboliphyme baturini TaxID=241478 RepID=A0A183IZJ0_9BILA|nr:unnamed protein product [Soboliphyme baturini]
MSVSASTSASEQDLPSKYRRLASAYAKIRSELKMVRNTLQEEEIRGRNKSMQLNESEARIQRLEAEVESLNFRNIQLEKRVSVLRKELETSRMDYDSKMPARASSRISLFRKMSHSTSEQIIDPARCALENELATKIADNESLVKKIRDMEVAYETEMEQRKRRIAELEADNLSLQQQLHTAVEDQETQMSELQRCHRTLTERFQTLQNECSKERQLAKK